MKLVNHGAPTFTQRLTYPEGGFRVWVEHDGPDNHHLLQPDEQCECGVIGLALVRLSPDAAQQLGLPKDDAPLHRNDFKIFYEEFTEVHSIGCDAAYLPTKQDRRHPLFAVMRNWPLATGVVIGILVWTLLTWIGWLT
jgi:hypothetical protein